MFKINNQKIFKIKSKIATNKLQIVILKKMNSSAIKIIKIINKFL